MTLRLLLSATVVLLASGCDSTTSLDSPPPPLSAALFDADTDAFPSQQARSAASGSHHTNAAVRVGIVTTAVGLNLVIPALATEAVTRNAPELEDGTWVWKSEEDVLGTPVALRLEASPDGSEIDWRLTSQRLGDASGDVFTYYQATTSPDGRSGSWRLFLPDEAGVVLTADFEVRSADDREITFGVPEGRERGGSEVRYATDGSSQTFDLLLEPAGERTTVEWDLGSGAGSIVSDAFNGGERACWDASLRDVAC